MSKKMYWCQGNHQLLKIKEYLNRSFFDESGTEDISYLSSYFIPKFSYELSKTRNFPKASKYFVKLWLQSWNNFFFQMRLSFINWLNYIATFPEIAIRRNKRTEDVLLYTIYHLEHLESIQKLERTSQAEGSDFGKFGK